MNKLIRMRARKHIQHVDDERALGNGVIVTLAEGWEFAIDPGCGVMGFDSVAEAYHGSTRQEVRRKA